MKSSFRRIASEPNTSEEKKILQTLTQIQEHTEEILENADINDSWAIEVTTDVTALCNIPSSSLSIQQAYPLTNQQTEEINNNPSRSTPLLSKPRSRSRARTQSRASNEEEQHYGVLVLKELAFLLLLTVLSLPNATNSFCEPSGIKPAEMSKEWLDGLPPDILAHSLLNAAFSIGINVYVLKDYIPIAWHELKASFGKCYETPKNFLGNFFSLLSSSAAALAFAAISYDAFKWVGEGYSVIPASTSLVTSFITRYPSVKKASRKIRGLVDKDMHFQRKIAHTLHHLKEEYQNDINRLITANKYKLNGKDLVKLLNTIGIQYSYLSLEDLLIKKSKKEMAIEYAKTSLNTLYALLVALTAFVVFTQKGADGFKIPFHYMGLPVEEFSRTDDFFLGITAGTVSATLYFLSALNLLPVLTDVIKDLVEDFFYGTKALLFHPIRAIQDTSRQPERLARFFKLSLGLTANGFASGSMVTVGKGIMANKNAIFPTNTSFPFFTGLGGATINTNATLNQILKKEREEKKKHPHLKNFADLLEETRLPQHTEVGNVSYETIPHLKKFTIFVPPPVIQQVEEGYVRLEGGEDEAAQQTSICDKVCILM